MQVSVDLAVQASDDLTLESYPQIQRYNSILTVKLTLTQACSPEAPLEKNALFYGFSGMTGCSPDVADLSYVVNPPGQDPIIDKMQHVASFLLIRGPYAWIGWAWLGCGNFPYRPKGQARVSIRSGLGLPRVRASVRAGVPGRVGIGVGVRVAW